MQGFIKNTASILAMLKKEVPLQVEMSALLTASIPTEKEERLRIEKAIEHFKKKVENDNNDSQSQETLQRLTQELENSNYKAVDENKISFTHESLREHLNIIFCAD